MKKKNNKIWYVLGGIAIIVLIFGILFVNLKQVNLQNPQENQIEKQKEVYFYPEDFNPVWSVYGNYTCDKGNLSIQANTYKALKHTESLEFHYIDCYYKIGDYIKENVYFDDVDTFIGDFDTSKGYSITLCCVAKNKEGANLSEEYCNTEYLEPLCL